MPRFRLGFLMEDELIVGSDGPVTSSDGSIATVLCCLGLSQLLPRQGLMESLEAEEDRSRDVQREEPFPSS